MKRDQRLTVAQPFLWRGVRIICPLYAVKSSIFKGLAPVLGLGSFLAAKISLGFLYWRIHFLFWFSSFWYFLLSRFSCQFGAANWRGFIGEFGLFSLIFCLGSLM
ncbi:hypothetical protein [Pseudomonas gingeri]